MTKSGTPEKTVLETILKWSEDRSLWQRDALRRIVVKGKIDDDDIKEFVNLCKQGKGSKATTLKADPLDKKHLPASPGDGDGVALVSIAEVLGVNNLAPKQSMEFEREGITIIYGHNGAGKSGYARILKRICRARYPGKIEPNIYAAEPPPEFGTSKITYSIGGKEHPSEEWKDGDNPHPVLSAVSVFDCECAAIHIKAKNEVAFKPFGLDIPDELANVCQAVKEVLGKEQKLLEQSQNPIFQKPSWKETTAVGIALSSLKHDSDLKALETLGVLTADETARLGRLREDLSKNPAKAAAEQTLKADNVKRLGEAIAVVASKTTDEALMKVASVAVDAVIKRQAATIAASNAFAGEPLKEVGGEVWRELWNAARQYSQEIVYPGEPFPSSSPDVRCVLCQQILDDSARDRMVRFEEFIQKETEKQAQESEDVAKASRKKLAGVIIDSRSLKANLQEVALHDAKLAREVRRFIASCRIRRYAVLKAIDDGREVKLPSVTSNPFTEVMKLESRIRLYAEELAKAAKDDERKKLEVELSELNDRALLGALIDIVKEEVERLKTIRFLKECGDDTATNAITKLGNDLADTAITPKLRDRFQQEIVKLAADKVRVEIVRSGGKYGSPEYQVRLFAKPDAKIQDILSEGEKTCVALASFLTELATSTHRSALVFDDPVTSLDHRWRTQVAKRLVAESEIRQIIVFTHDLIFVNDLDDLADKSKRPIRLITVSRGKEGAGIVSEGLPWKGKSVEDRIDKLEKDARAAERLYKDNKEEEYNSEAADIYSKLRASWERGLEDIAFSRVVQRHRDYIDPKTLKKVSVLTEEDCDKFHAGYKKCCNVTDAHDPSSGRNAEAPPPQELHEDIQALKDWVASLRVRQKDIA